MSLKANNSAGLNFKSNYMRRQSSGQSALNSSIDMVNEAFGELKRDALIHSDDRSDLSLSNSKIKMVSGGINSCQASADESSVDLNDP